MRYSEFVHLVHRFRGRSVVELCSHMQWDLWMQGRAGFDNQDVALLRAHGGRIALIAEAHGAQAGLEPRGADLIRLAHELLEVDVGLLEEAFRQGERSQLLAAWSSSPTLKRYVLSEEATGAAMLALTLGRMMRSQWHVTHAHSHALPRAWELVRRVQRRADARDTIEVLTRALRMEPLAFLRAAYVLIAALGHARGRVDLRAIPLEPALASRWSIDGDALLLVAERLSQHAEDVRRWDKEVVTPLPDEHRKFAPSPLLTLPLLQRRQFAAAPVAERGRYNAPCPGSTLLAIQNVCLHALREPSRDRPQGYSVELGHALEDYLYDLFMRTVGHENVMRLDGPTDSSKHADFIVILERQAFVVECKSLLGSASAKAIGSAADTVGIWGRIHGAYEQCAGTVKDAALWRSSPRLAQVTEIACLVCFDEVLCLEGTAFNMVASIAGITNELGVDRIETVTLQYLESAMQWHGLEGLFDFISRKWAAGKQGDDLSAYIVNTGGRGQRSQGGVPPHLAEAFAELLPGLAK